MLARQATLVMAALPLSYPHVNFLGTLLNNARLVAFLEVWRRWKGEAPSMSSSSSFTGSSSSGELLSECVVVNVGLGVLVLHVSMAVLP